MLNLNRKIVLTAISFGLAGCVVVEPEPVPPGPQGCPRIYQPVCAERFGERETFPNGCTAEREGYRIVHAGQCRRQTPRPPSPPITERPKVCPQIYAPVCASRGAERRTFDNECVARGNGFTVIRNGTCG